MNITLDDFLNQFVQTTDFPSLDAMHYIMNKLDNPQKNLKFIHIAGTNGKGSICETLAQTLTKAGYKTGKFISPHLLVSNESICIDNIIISNTKVQSYIPRLTSIANEFENEFSRKVTRFEILTSMAILYYKENNCDICILETGLGGKYDCTNIVDSIISIFGSINFDHTSILGNSLTEIAIQKAGIIKSNSDTIIFDQNNDVIKEINKTCLEKNSTLHLLTQNDISNYQLNGTNQIFTFKNYKDIEINLIGLKQIENASICLECFEILKSKHNFKISNNTIKNSLKTIVHHARFEQLSKTPNIIFDGAHNENAMENLVNSINTYYNNSNNKLFIFSILSTKDYNKVLSKLKNINCITNSKIIFTSGIKNSTPYVDKDVLYTTALKLGFLEANISMMDFEDAIHTSITHYSNCDIFIIGSFYVYNKTIELLK